MENADLHTHSYYSSDSDISPEQLVIEGKKAGLKHIALTDHDSMQGINEFIKAGRAHEIDAIPGVEIHSEYGEVLGYFINHKNKSLINLCLRNKKAANQRALDTIKLLNKDGYGFNPDAIKKKYKREILERPLILNELVEKGYASSWGDAHSRFLSEGNKYYIKPDYLSTAKVIKIISTTGGAAVLAHPHIQDYKSEFNNIKFLIEAGLAGIECPSDLDNKTPDHYPINTPEITAQIKKLAKKYNLILTSGSDYHGTIHKYIILGTWGCDESVVTRLKQHAIRKKKNR